MKNITPQTHYLDDFHRVCAITPPTAWAVWPIIGDPVNAVAQDFGAVERRGGFTGIGLSLVNYLNQLPYFCAEVLPRLARLGLRDSRSPE